MIQVSDRRTTAPDGRVLSDHANKATVVACADAMFSIAFTGVAAYDGNRTDLALCQDLLDAGATELGIDRIVDIISTALAGRFRKLPATSRHLVLSLAGYQYVNDSCRSRVIILSNVDHQAGGYTAAAKDDFLVAEIPVRKGHVTFHTMGSGHAAITRGDRTRFQARLRTLDGSPVSHRTINALEDGLVTLIRSASERSHNRVGKHCMAICLTAARDARAIYYDAGNARPKVYGPHYLWSDGGRNFLVTDIESLDDKPGYSLGFGDPDRFHLVIGTSDAQHQIPTGITRIKHGMQFTKSMIGTPLGEARLGTFLLAGSAFRASDG